MPLFFVDIQGNTYIFLRVDKGNKQNKSKREIIKKINKIK